MIKFFSLYFLLFITYLGYSQVGINVLEPTEALDVNGDIRIRNTNEMTNDLYLLTTDNTGVVTKTSTSFAEMKVESHIIESLESGQSTSLYNDGKFDEASVMIFSKNACDRKMLASLTAFRNTFLFINGIARDKIAIASLNTTQYGISFNWNIVFPNVITCNKDGGNGTQFNFSIEKKANYEYVITNNGNTIRTYYISFIKL